MPFLDMPLDQLRTYQPARTEPRDFDAFWQQTLDEAHAYPLYAVFMPIDCGLRTVEVFDASFNGWGGQTIKGWFLLPRQRIGRLPCVVEFVGYGGGRGFATEWLLWSSTGRAHFIMDTRGQGSSWRKGDTPDPEPAGSNPHFPGFMTRGILDPKTYYYRRVFTDAVRAIEAARTHPAVDPDRIAVAGGSQGGGIALAAAGLDPTVAAVMADVPFLCHYQRATELTAAHPYEEIAKFCQVHRDKVDQVFETLAYFDGVNLGARARGRALFSAGLMDEVCPPSTVFAAHNWYGGPKEMVTYRYNHHEGGGAYHDQVKLRFLNQLWPC